MVEQGENNLKDKVLKDLEQNLAKELDGSALAAAAATPPPAAAISAAATQVAAAAVANVGLSPVQEAQKATGLAPAVGLSDIDEILKSQDPGFEQSLEGLQSDLKGMDAGAKLESLGLPDNFDVDDEGGTADKSGDTVGTLGEEKNRSLVVAIARAGVAVVIALPKIVAEIVPTIKSLKGLPPKQMVGALVPALKTSLKTSLQPVGELADLLKGYKTIVYIKLVILVALLYASVLMLKAAYVSYYFGDTVDLEIVSFDRVADRIVELSEGGGEAEEALSHPEFVVQISRVIANLKASEGRRLSMVSVEFYLEASNQEAAIEMKDREQEIRHTIARVLEQWTFDDLEPASGKSKLKVYVRAALNKILSRGRVKRVFFKSITMQK